jgi:TnpA family transposase
MPRRRIFTERQQSALFDLPTDEPVILYHYTLADDDIEHIRTRRHSRNRLGFALQLCAFRYPVRLLTTGETIPLEISKFIAAQLGENPDHLIPLCGNCCHTTQASHRSTFDLRLQNVFRARCR